MTEKPPSSMARYAVWYVLALILLLSIFQYYSAMQQAVEISYSEFRHRHHHGRPFAQGHRRIGQREKKPRPAPDPGKAV